MVSHHFQALQLSVHLGASESAPSSAPFVPRYPPGSLFRSLLKATTSERLSLTLWFIHVLTCLLFSISESSIRTTSVHEASLESNTFKGKLKVQRPQINVHNMLKEQEEGGHGQSRGQGEGWAKRGRQGWAHKGLCGPGQVVWVLSWVRRAASEEL